MRKGRRETQTEGRWVANRPRVRHGRTHLEPSCGGPTPHGVDPEGVYSDPRGHGDGRGP